MKLAGKTAVVTGASRGIGRACSLKFAAEGANVVLADVHVDEGTRAAEEIRASGGSVLFVETDVAVRDANERLIDRAVETFGSLDILLCNAGVILAEKLTGSSDEAIHRLWDVNVNALVYACRYAIPIMLGQENHGTILFTASKTGLVAQEGSPIYCASKGAAVMLARALALDYAKEGIRVNALCPGIIETPMLRTVADDAKDPAAEWKFYSEAQPMGRLGTAEECAEAALWLVSDDASFVTGVALPVDGGFTAM